MDNYFLASKPLRIGIDCRLWRETGVGRYIQNLLIELDASKPECTFILFVLPKDKEDIKNKIKNVRFEILEADIRWHSLKEQIVFPIILYKSHCDLIHFPYFSIPIFYFKPFVLTIHDMITWRFATGKASTLPLWLYWIKQLAYRFVVFIGARWAQRIITVSKETEKDVIHYLRVSSSKITVIYEGVDNGFVKHIKSLLMSEIPVAKYFLCVGNAYPHKNFKRLVEAFTLFHKNHEDIYLVFVGSNNYFYNELKHWVSIKKIPHVIFSGFISDSKLSFLYQHALATIVPSLMEGFGLPALEAMAEKCIVLASELPVLKEICDDVPFYFDPKHTESIAQMLDFVYKAKKSLLNTKREKGFRLVKNFSLKKMAEETLHIYESSISVRQNQ